MAITTCGHTETVTHVLAEVLHLEVEDVEAGILNAMAHRIYQRLGIRSNASRDTVAKAVRQSLLAVTHEIGDDRE